MVTAGPRNGSATLSEIEIEATDAARGLLSSLGRTEDVRLSPDGRRLAIACYARDRIAVADVEMTRAGDVVHVAVTAVAQFASPHLRVPHGVDWLDGETLVVGNRGAGIAVLRLTREGLVPVGAGGSAPEREDAPGSVVVRSLGDDRHEVLACRNWANTVTRHELGPDGRLVQTGVAVRRWLDLPDGLALSADGRWLAVSSHNTASVLVYRADALEHADPVAILRGVAFPHGIRFCGGDSRLLVADAGAPSVHVFAAPGATWSGVAYPAASLAVMDDETFSSGHVSPQEGGPKGIDLDPLAGVLVTTAEHAPLAFFDVAAVLESPGAFAPDADALLRYELGRLAAAKDAKQAVTEAQAALHAVLHTKAWRLTALPRRLYAMGRRAARRESTVSSGTSSATSSGVSAIARSDSSP